MDDNIELPPLPPVLGAPGMNLWIDDLRRVIALLLTAEAVLTGDCDD